MAADKASMLATNATFDEDFTLDRPISVSLTGGFSTDFATNTGYTSLHGILTVQSGSLTVNNFLIR